MGEGWDAARVLLALCQTQWAAPGSHPLPGDPRLACCYDCSGNSFNMFCSSEMLCLALFGLKAA